MTKLVMGLIFLIGLGVQQTQAAPEGDCLYWQSRVDPNIRLPKGVVPPDVSNEQNAIQAMRCLLDLEGNKSKSTIEGATRADTSQVFGVATVEVAALYYISYLYYENWGHAGAACLRRNGELTNDAVTVADAYKAYRRWFDKVKEIGLRRAREKRIAPLQGTALSWY
jgi:hypothetical protein